MVPSGSIIYNWIFPRGQCSLSVSAKASRREPVAPLALTLQKPVSVSLSPFLCNNWKALIHKYNTATWSTDLILRPLWLKPQLDTSTRFWTFCKLLVQGVAKVETLHFVCCPLVEKEKLIWIITLYMTDLCSCCGVKHHHRHRVTCWKPGIETRNKLEQH